jgi:methionyl-tRNA formyltransferase
MEPNQPRDPLTPSIPRFAFFGTPSVASETLAALADHGYVPSLVVTAPDARQGRGMLYTPSPVKAWALRFGVPLITPDELTKGVVANIKEYGCDYAIVVAYGKIFPQMLIHGFPKGVLNIHYSLLPKYRGASPVEAALLDGETITGVTIQKMVKQLDAGDILSQREVPIEHKDTARELRVRLIEEGVRLLIESLPSFLAGTAVFTPQDESKATTCGKILKDDRELDFPGSSERNWNKYRAYAEGPGTYFYMVRNDKRFRVKVKTASYEDGHFEPLRVIPEGKKEMDFRVLHTTARTTTPSERGEHPPKPL